MDALHIATIVGNVAGASLGITYYFMVERSISKSFAFFLFSRWCFIALLVNFNSSFILSPLLGTVLPLILLASSYDLPSRLIRFKFWRWVAVAGALGVLTWMFITKHSIFLPSAFITYGAGLTFAFMVVNGLDDALITAVFIGGFMSDVREYSILFYVMRSAHVPWYFALCPHALAWMCALLMMFERGLLVNPLGEGWRSLLLADGLALCVLANAYPVIKYSCAHGWYPYCHVFLNLPYHVELLLNVLFRASPLIIASSFIKYKH